MLVWHTSKSLGRHSMVKKASGYHLCILFSALPYVVGVSKKRSLCTHLLPRLFVPVAQRTPLLIAWLWWPARLVFIGSTGQ